MKSQKAEESSQELNSEMEVPVKVRKPRTAEGDGEPGAARIKLPSSIAIRARETVAELKIRGAQVGLDELFSEYIEAIPEAYFEAQLLRRTPEPYYLDAAMQFPELREMLIRHAKRGLLKTKGTGGPPRVQRRSQKNTESALPGSASDASH